MDQLRSHLSLGPFFKKMLLFSQEIFTKKVCLDY